MFRLIFKQLKYLVKTLVRGPPPPPDTSRISNVPLELLLLISDNLPLASQFSLSRTCRRAYHSVKRDWLSEARKLPPEERLRCLLHLVYNVPDRAVCGTCHRIFKVNDKDFPGAVRSGRFVRHGCVVAKEWQYLETQCCDADNEYGLSHDHVQLALKYTRLGVRAGHLEAIMRPWSFSEDKSKRRRRLHSTYELKCAQTPRIVGGRFIHESVWEVRCKYNGPIHGSQVASTWPGIFRHIYLLFYGGALTPGRCYHNPLFPGVRSWQVFVASETMVRSFWCRVCRAEFRFEIGYNKWSLKCWMDLGTETEPVRHPETWRMSERRRYEHDQEATRPVSSGPGPIEAMFISGGGGLPEGSGTVNRAASQSRLSD